MYREISITGISEAIAAGKCWVMFITEPDEFGNEHMDTYHYTIFPDGVVRNHEGMDSEISIHSLKRDLVRAISLRNMGEEVYVDYWVD